MKDFLGKWLSPYFKDSADWLYWSNVLYTTGAACLAVAFIELNVASFGFGLISVLAGLEAHRKGRE